MSQEVQYVIGLTGDELAIVIDALDALEYWQYGDSLPRNDGQVFIPGDLPPEDDRYWGPEPDPSASQATAIDDVRACRALVDRFLALSPAAAES